MDDRWPSCEQDGCSGACIDGKTRCLAHVGPKERGTALERFSESGELDVRGVTISDALCGEIFDAAPHDADGHRAFSAAWFGGATFESTVRFDGATFEGTAQFGNATFLGPARFDVATFEGTAGFDVATFEGGANFGGATFNGAANFDVAKFKHAAWFGGATFENTVRFSRATFKDTAANFPGATFKGHADFGEATFERDASFGEATFERDASFSETTFKAPAKFHRATFEGGADFGGATFNGDAYLGFQGDADFGEATFKGDVPVLGPITVDGRLDVDGVQFASAVRIKADAGVLSCQRGRFPGGVRLDVQRAVVRLDDSDLSVPSLLTGPPVSDPDGIAGQPKLLSLQGTNVAGLALGNVSLADCRFAGAHNLDKLRVEADTVFGLSPAMAGWERRQVIAEETAWRATRTRPGRWKPPPWPGPEAEPKPLSPGAIAGLYRALRKGREDAKDEPDAADFYYGEMEMRRHDQGTDATNEWRGRASRIVLTVYWLVSGYGQRAWRSLAALATVTSLFAVAFHYIGFTTPPEPASYWTSLLYAFRSTISLTDSQVTLTAWGSFFQALLRITGPVLLGLTLLALRGRVKR
jgi:uncharacterized protein YjbI with pentapeptide repeats